MALKSYDNEFKEMIVGLLHSGMSRKAVGDEYNLNYAMIGRWKCDYADRNGDFTNSAAPLEGDIELEALRKELREVKMKRHILKWQWASSPRTTGNV